jgi:hypothetical protein
MLRGQEPTAIEQTISAGRKHCTIDIGEPRLAAWPHALRELEREIAGPSGDIEHAIACAHSGEGHGESLPQAVQACGHEIVHEVVSGRHRGENAGDTAGLLALVDRLESEVRLGHAVILARGYGRSERLAVAAGAGCLKPFQVGLP